MQADSLHIGVLSPAAWEPVPNATSKDSPEKIRDAATQFEALLIGQVLKTVHEGEKEGWLGTGEDESASSALAIGDEYFARAMAARGGLGLARMISASLEKSANSSSLANPAGPTVPNGMPRRDP